MYEIVLDEFKGYCLSNEREVQKDSKSQETVLSDGIFELPWDAYLDFDSDKECVDPRSSSAGNGAQNDGKKKMNKREKREYRLQRKIRASMNKKARREQESSRTSSEPITIDDNPYALQQKISNVHKKILDHANAGKEKEVKLFQYYSISAYKSDLSYIMPDEWISDNNISLIFEMINQVFLKNPDIKFGKQITLLCPSVVQLFLHFPIDEKFESILPTKELEESKLVFMPVNYMDDTDIYDLEQVNNGDHWVLCLLNLMDNCLYVYNSMREDDDEDQKTLVELINRLQKCKSIVGGKQKIKIIHMNCDQQTNSNDCGVFLLMITCILAKRLLFKDRIILDISNVKFSTLAGRLRIMELMYRISSMAKED
ncbi:Piso0_000696 [Millerozyma farinosa CBS 7064]|uniref:Piso0_000696 protein n=1 Tax=Pichia sorbitophila (strain ATCC MYA-4447 / BCRC 22081 / CBS 7064 / NBRC 10061 / NRRL Y-12695) TaxID=559304 RepID=G8YR96_PICSO|nr:Piso0_000696 [Millerozyma farinosa CBS 7064]